MTAPCQARLRVIFSPHVLITDLDNTLYNWIDYFAPCFRAMVEDISLATGVDEDELHRQFQAVYRSYQAPEYRWAICELEVMQKLHTDEVNQLVWSGFNKFIRGRSRHLYLYPGVEDMLRTLKGRGFTVIGVSNAPVREVLSRVRCLKIYEHLDALVAWEGVHRGDQRLASRTVPLGLELHTFPKQHLKPSTHPYDEALRRFAPQSHGRVIVLGDSIGNDLVPGHQIGALTVWARYGTRFEPENFKTLSRLSYWDTEHMKQVYASDVVDPDEIIDEASELIRLVDSYAPCTV